MVKVIIQTGDKEIVKEGDFLLGAMCRDAGNRWETNIHAIGKMDKALVPQIAANIAVNVVQDLHKGNEIDRIETLLELHDRIGKLVQKEVKANKDCILQEVSQILDGFKGGF